MQRFGPLTALALLVFGVGFLLGLQLAPLNQTMALGLGSGAVVPVVVAYLAAEWRR
jgi:hypothetical protein